MTLVIFHKIMILHYSVLYIYRLLPLPYVAIFYTLPIGIYAVECTVYIFWRLHNTNVLRDMLLCETWDCYTDYCIGDCDAVYCGRNLPTFQKKALPAYSEQDYSEDGSIRFLRKVRTTGLYWCVMKVMQVSLHHFYSNFEIYWQFY